MGLFRKKSIAKLARFWSNNGTDLMNFSWVQIKDCPLILWIKKYKLELGNRKARRSYKRRGPFLGGEL